MTIEEMLEGATLTPVTRDDIAKLIFRKQLLLERHEGWLEASKFVADKIAEFGGTTNPGDIMVEDDLAVMWDEDDTCTTQIQNLTNATNAVAPGMAFRVLSDSHRAFMVFGQYARSHGIMQGISAFKTDLLAELNKNLQAGSALTDSEVHVVSMARFGLAHAVYDDPKKDEENSIEFLICCTSAAKSLILKTGWNY